MLQTGFKVAMHKELRRNRIGYRLDKYGRRARWCDSDEFDTVSRERAVWAV